MRRHTTPCGRSAQPSTLTLSLTEAQKKVATVPFCATPTLEGSGCAIDAGGLLLCNGAAVGDGTAVFIRPASFNAPTLVGDHLSPLRSGTCAVRGLLKDAEWPRAQPQSIERPGRSLHHIPGGGRWPYWRVGGLLLA